MKKIITKILFTWLKLLSYLPLSILYILASVIQFFVQHILHYRQTVINTNLAYALPYKSSLEVNKIRRKYYHHLSCIVVEIIKYISISKNSIDKRISLTHQAKQLLFDLRNEQVPLFVLLGHFGNWEWASYLAANATNKKAYALYAPSNNITFDNEMKKIRERLGLHTILNSDIKKIIEVCQQNNLIAILADQTPVDTDKAYWTNFLGIKTPFHQAYANIAHKQNAIVLYASIHKN
ncbi:MAG: lysophospholipid acyltransferase family protein [Chitinophagales bacterium]